MLQLLMHATRSTHLILLPLISLIIFCEEHNSEDLHYVIFSIFLLFILNSSSGTDTLLHNKRLQPSRLAPSGFKVRFGTSSEAFTALEIQVEVLWVVTPCSIVVG
jgi:hypothetical protein